MLAPLSAREELEGRLKRPGASAEGCTIFGAATRGPVASNGCIPDFTDHGLLPDGIYLCTLLDLRAHFVDGQVASKTRRLVCTGYEMLTAAAQACGVHSTDWVGGSFVERKTDPNDLDVVHFVRSDIFDALPAEARDFVFQRLANDAAQRRFLTHSLWAPVFPPGHPLYPKYLERRAYFRKWWGTTRGMHLPDGAIHPGRIKGFLRLVIGDVQLSPTVPETR